MEFNVGVGKALLAMRDMDKPNFKQIIEGLRGSLAEGFSPTSTASLHASHDTLIKLHTLYELETISGMSPYAATNRETILENLDRRLDLLGAYTSDKQYLLGIRRAAMQVSE
jgi:serine/threonine-protein kinase ATR